MKKAEKKVEKKKDSKPASLLQTSTKVTPHVEAKVEIKEKCPSLSCPACAKCPSENPLVELSAEGGKDFALKLEDNQEISFRLIPNNYRDSLNSIEVIDHDKI